MSSDPIVSGFHNLTIKEVKEILALYLKETGNICEGSHIESIDFTDTEAILKITK